MKAQPVFSVVPVMLKWARETAGMEIPDVARRVKVGEDIVAGWEVGNSAPTYAQLETLAYSVYKRPLAIFFFPEPPNEPTPQKDFRLLPNVEQLKLSRDTRLKIRKGHAYQ